MTLHIRTAPEEQDLEVIHRFLSTESTWALGIPRQRVEAAVRHSLNFGGFVNGKQVAYARVVTDRATIAYLCDVFVLPAYRGHGHSRRLMEAVMAHPHLQGLRRFMLATSTARGLYEKFGFGPPLKPESLMERLALNPYLPATAD